MTQAPAIRSTSYRILVVDDNIDCAEMLADALEYVGYEVKIAHNGADALKRQAEFHPDLAVLDLALPGMDGVELARRLQDAAQSGLALIALTGFAPDEYGHLTHAAGFAAHLLKPIDIDVLTDSITAVRSASRSPALPATKNSV